MKKLFIGISLILLTASCGRQFREDYDFRNFLRDRHPDCEIQHVGWTGNISDRGWTYIVEDKDTKDRWLYEGHPFGYHYIYLNDPKRLNQ